MDESYSAKKMFDINQCHEGDMLHNRLCRVDELFTARSCGRNPFCKLQLKEIGSNCKVENV